MVNLNGLPDLLTVLRTFVVKLTHGWLPIGVRERRCSATNDLARNASKSRLFHTCTAARRASTWRNRFLILLQGHLTETDTAADIRCMIIKGIENWFLNGDTNNPESIEAVEQIGWFQVLKGYIPKEWTSRQERFYRRRRKDPKYSTGEQWTTALIEFFWTHGKILWKDRALHLEKTAQTTPVHVFDKRRNNAWKRHTHTPRSC
jgi:hypothetical protein